MKQTSITTTKRKKSCSSTTVVASSSSENHHDDDNDDRQQPKKRIRDDKKDNDTTSSSSLLTDTKSSSSSPLLIAFGQYQDFLTNCNVIDDDEEEEENDDDDDDDADADNGNDKTEKGDVEKKDVVIKKKNKKSKDDDDDDDVNIEPLLEIIKLLDKNSNDDSNKKTTTTTDDKQVPSSWWSNFEKKYNLTSSSASNLELPPKLLKTTYTTIPSLEPILLSLTHLHLASHYISKSMETTMTSSNTTAPSSSFSFDNSCRHHFRQSLRHWRYNPATLSLLANYRRMTTSSSDDVEQIALLYEIASRNAHLVRLGGIEILMREDKEEEEGVDDEVKEWVELLILNGCGGVEYLGGDGGGDYDLELMMMEPPEDDDDGDDDEEEEEEKEKEPAMNKEDKPEEKEKQKETKKEQQQQQPSNDDDEDDDVDDDDDESFPDEFSPSEIEETSTFMAAMIRSTLRHHDKALDHLKKFNLSHRIHPLVWDTAAASSAAAPPTTPSKDDEPFYYHSEKGILPPKLLHRLQSLFAPSSPYWNESDYQNRGYYSYFQPVVVSKSNNNHPKNLIDDVIIHHLLPLLPHPQKITGVEWWVHSRPTNANLGHQLHFDTDETFLNVEKKIRHPKYSTVLCLSSGKDDEKEEEDEGGSGGATIIFDQRVDSETVAERCWLKRPTVNSLLVFDGGLLHGVLPCRPSSGGQQQRKAKDDDNGSDDDDVGVRCTFMVGFWEDKKQQSGDQDDDDDDVYGPSRPIPPATKDHTWVQMLSEGYTNNNDDKQAQDEQKKVDCSSRDDVTRRGLTMVTPAWEDISRPQKEQTTTTTEEEEDGDEDDEEPPLTIPQGIDHRFFVHDAPHCFKESLFRSDEGFA